MKNEITNSTEELNPWNEMINMILESGMEGVPKAMEILLDEAMKIERDQERSSVFVSVNWGLSWQWFVEVIMFYFSGSKVWDGWQTGFFG